jgi:predicted phage terminase large subunit-like protein
MPLDAGRIKPADIDKELLKRAGESYRAFVALANPKFAFYDHCDALAGVIERIAAGELKRVMIFLPPRHSKSEMFSRLFSAYYLRKHPDKWVGINSYAAQLAFTLSSAARQNFVKCGGELSDDSKSKQHWETKQGGGMWAAGVGGPITGKGFHLGIIDDPLKNSEEANSEVIREKHKEWYKTTFLTREEPDAAIVIILTRWHEDDLAGWLLNEETTDEDEHSKENWHIVCLPAIAEELPEFPPTCTIESDTREIGEPLCPERYPLEKLMQKRAKGAREFDALYQQRPSPKEGYFFDVTKLHIVDAAPVGGRKCRGTDKAATPGDGDYTASGLVQQGKDGLWYIEDVWREQLDTATRDRRIRQTAEMDGRTVHQKGEQEPGSGGKESAENFIRLLSGFPVSTEKSTANKESRADPFSSQVNAGNVRLVKGDWNKAFIEELRQFPFGKHDDQVDAVTLAFNHLNSRQEWSQGTRQLY